MPGVKKGMKLDECCGRVEASVIALESSGNEAHRKEVMEGQTGAGCDVLDTLTGVAQTKCGWAVTKVVARLWRRFSGAAAGVWLCWCG